MRTFWIQTLGCKVNQYESEQVATLLRHRGMVASEASIADLRIVNTCSVTSESASKSRQNIRRAVRLNVLSPLPASFPAPENNRPVSNTGRVIAMGCWATSNREEAAKINGVDAVLTHHDNVAVELNRLLDQWQKPAALPEGSPRNPSPLHLPLLDSRHTGHQRAFLKIQDGCDAHCTYCIIPQLRPKLWSKPIEDVLREARSLVDAGHRELILTGIFLSAYGHPTALRRRQTGSGTSACGELGRAAPLSNLLKNLCTQVPGLERLRLSSLEPGDLTPQLLRQMRDLPQIVPHFHLPLQSGSEKILRRMNRQYTRDNFLAMIESIHETYDRVALTTDIIAGFPGETEADFSQTLDIVERAKFIHIHAFPFSPRPGTAAARWRDDFVPSPVSSDRVRMLQYRAAQHSYQFRLLFSGEILQVHVEESTDAEIQHGRTPWYFPVHFSHPERLTGQAIDLRIDKIDPTQTWGTLLNQSAKLNTASPRA